MSTLLHARYVMLHVNDGVVLNAGFLTDMDVVHIPANGDVAPYAGAFADLDIADDLSAWIDVGRSGNPGDDAAIGTNHDYGFLMLAHGFAGSLRCALCW